MWIYIYIYKQKKVKLELNFTNRKTLQNVSFNMKGNERKDNRRREAYGMGREGVKEILWI